MMNQELLLQIIGEWLHDTNLPSPVPRESPVISVESLSTILAIVGPRRAGKTFFLLQMIRNLLDSGHVNQEEVLFVDFEDYRLKGFASVDMDGLLAAFQQLTGHEPRFLFFDEVQHLPEWSRVLRTLHNRRRYRMVIAGSNSSLLSSEIATELRGRYEDALLLPFSFREFLRFQNLPYDKALLHTAQRGRIMAAFDDYLRFGGFPETFLRDSVAEKRKLLQNYYTTLFYKDILERYNIKARTILDQMMMALLNGASELFSISTFEKQLKAASLSGSKRTIANYLHFLEEAFFLITNEKFSYSARKRMMNPLKVYLMDTGFGLLSGAFSENRGKWLENMVAIELYRQQKRMFYFKENQECDFVVQEGGRPAEAWQVCWEVTSKNEKREFKGLLEAMGTLKLRRGGILTHNQEAIRSFDGKTVRLIPVWKWLLLGPEGQKV